MTDSAASAGELALSPAAVGRAAPTRSDGGRSAPLTLAGTWFVVAGLGTIAPAIVAQLPNPLRSSRASGFAAGIAAYAPMMLSVILCSAAVVVGSFAAFVVLTRARFPHRSPLMTFVTISLAVVSPLVALARFGFMFGSALETVADVVPVIGGGLLLVFAISAARNRVLPLGFRIVPVVQFALAVLAYVVYLRTAFPIDINGIAFLGVGTAYIVLASNARSALEAAASR